jgi:hypothetical protein
MLQDYFFNTPIQQIMLQIPVTKTFQLSCFQNHSFTSPQEVIEHMRSISHYCITSKQKHPARNRVTMRKILCSIWSWEWYRQTWAEKNLVLEKHHDHLYSGQRLRIMIASNSSTVYETWIWQMIFTEKPQMHQNKMIDFRQESRNNQTTWRNETLPWYQSSALPLHSKNIYFNIG